MARRSSARSLPMVRSTNTRLTRTISVVVPVPRSVARRARRVTYAYKFPRPLTRERRVVRVPYFVPRERFVPVRVRLLVPRYLPLVASSYVSMTDSGQAIHSRRQIRRLLQREFNRRRYEEHKSNRRKARNGQLESVRSDRLGMLGYAARSGFGPRRMADVAMVSRALGG